ncbi:MAG TPA: hypothetical protein VLA13_03485 [Massilibacterium sp.]|nr:hypothetical protein [Massilibacterium sp.]
MIVNNERTNRCKKYFNELILDDLSNYKVWIAGGAIRSWFANERRSDIDLFFPSEDDRNKAKEFLKGTGGESIFENENVEKIKYEGQVFDFCKPLFDTPEDTINNFDFTVSMFACDGKDMYVGENSFMDLASKRICINRCPFPMSSLSRLQKYIRKGYWICSEEMVKFTAILQGVDLTSFTVEDQFQEDFNQSDSGNTFPGMD